MAQEKVWDDEYRNQVMVTGHDKPQADVLRFFKYLKKQQGVDLSGLTVLDLGSGTGRNANYLSQKGCKVIGIEVSGVAVKLATERSSGIENPPKYLKQSMGENWPVADSSVDLVLDVLSSNSLNGQERSKYLSELKRVTRPGTYIFVKTLCKDGDKNAAGLLMNYPGQEPDTYVLPKLKLTERVFGLEDFKDLYKDFEILKLETKKSHIPFGGQVYNRKFILAYLKNPA